MNYLYYVVTMLKKQCHSCHNHIVTVFVSVKTTVVLSKETCSPVYPLFSGEKDAGRLHTSRELENILHAISSATFFENNIVKNRHKCKCSKPADLFTY